MVEPEVPFSCFFLNGNGTLPALVGFGGSEGGGAGKLDEVINVFGFLGNCAFTAIGGRGGGGGGGGLGSSNSPSSGDDGATILLGLPLGGELLFPPLKFLRGGRLSGEAEGDLDAGLLPLLAAAGLTEGIEMRK